MDGHLTLTRRHSYLFSRSVCPWQAIHQDLSVLLPPSRTRLKTDGSGYFSAASVCLWSLGYRMGVDLSTSYFQFSENPWKMLKKRPKKGKPWILGSYDGPSSLQIRLFVRPKSQKDPEKQEKRSQAKDDKKNDQQRKKEEKKDPGFKGGKDWNQTGCGQSQERTNQARGQGSLYNKDRRIAGRSGILLGLVLSLEKGTATAQQGGWLVLLSDFGWKRTNPRWKSMLKDKAENLSRVCSWKSNLFVLHFHRYVK